MTRFALVLVVIVAFAPAAHGRQKIEKWVSAGAKCYEQLNYGCAIRKLASAADRHTSENVQLPPALALKLYETLAFALASVDKHSEAQNAFTQCFAARPTYRLDPKVISPKLYADFKAARDRVLALQGVLRTPATPAVHPPPLPQEADLLLHQPLLLGPVAQTGELAHNVDLFLGAHLLFGDDAERFKPGFGVALQYGYAIAPWVSLEVTAAFYQHVYAGTDLKAGKSGTLFIFDPSVGLRFHHRFVDVVELGIGVLAGASLMGVGYLPQNTGFVAGVPLSATYRPLKQFGIGIQVVPSFVLAMSEDDELARSFTLSLLARIELSL